MSLVEALSTRREPLRTNLKRRSADDAIKRNGFIEIPVDARFLEPRIEVIQEAMCRITDDPVRREHFPWTVFHKDIYGRRYYQEVGLKCTQADDPDGERKFTFHYCKGMATLLRNFGLPMREYRHFFEALDDFDQWSLDIAVAIAERFDAANQRPMNGEARYPSSMVEKVLSGSRIIRVLRYTEAYAVPHVDRSLFTIHPWSSRPGLKVLNVTESEWVPLRDTSLNTAAVFPGEKFAALTRGIFGYGTLHGVSDMSKHNGEDRYAIVCFTHPKPTKEDSNWLAKNWENIKQFEEAFKERVPMA